MNKQTKLLAALTTAARKTKNPKLKVKIKKIKQKKSLYDWLAM
jgi:hypothetical protein